MSTEKNENQITKEVRPNPERKRPLNLVLMLLLLAVVANSAWMFYVTMLVANSIQQYHDENVCLKQQLNAKEQTAPSPVVYWAPAYWPVYWVPQYSEPCQGETVYVSAHADAITGSFFKRTPSPDCTSTIIWDNRYNDPSFNPFDNFQR